MLNFDLNMCCGTVGGGGRRGAAACCSGPGGAGPLPRTAAGDVAVHLFVRVAQIYAVKAFAPIAYVLIIMYDCLLIPIFVIT